MKPLTRAQVMAMLILKLDSPSPSALARTLGVSRQYAHDMLKGKRAPCKAILKMLGLRRIKTCTETFVRISLDNKSGA